ncbi:MAG: radical SAM protein [Sedimentisphaerales bacterium]|nr:radical SAM protein [Sedimentisphaerales bacterium]
MSNTTITPKIGGSQLSENQEHFQRWLRGENPGPLAIEVGVAHGCNQNCVHCGFQQYSRYGDKIHCLEPPEAFDHFLEDFAQLGGREVYFAGHGEPLIHPQLPHWAAYGKSLGLDMTLSTNGILLKEHNRHDVLHNMKWIRFSISGGDTETYSQVHRCPETSFARLVDNLRRAVDYRNQSGLNVKLTILFIVYDLNWHSIPGIVRLHQEVGTDLLILRKANFDNDRQDIQPMKEMKAAVREFEGTDKVEIRWDSFQRPVKNHNWTKCYGIHFRTNMDSDGNVYTCARHFYKNSIYGNIIRQRFRDIWNSAEKNRIFAEAEQAREMALCGGMCQAGKDNIYIEQYRAAGK